MKSFESSAGMTMCPIPMGSFTRGTDHGFWEERPAHRVTIATPFYAASTPVTNLQYELFDPSHKFKRMHSPWCHGDNDPVVFVSLDEAKAYCAWLSTKESRPYRLPSEAEWEYAMRGSVKTNYLTGDELPEEFHRNPERSWYPDPGRFPRQHDNAVAVDLRVGQTPANAFGLCDVHGPVEQWCLDTYAAYPAHDCADPLCTGEGEFIVTRGGSHNTPEFYLRFGARMAALPQTAHWFIGFRVFCGEAKHQTYIITSNPGWAKDARQESASPRHLLEEGPQFVGPVRYVNVKNERLRVPEDIPAHDSPNGDWPEIISFGPHFMHNHVPAVCECPNGDLLAIWFSCNDEKGREMLILCSRLRTGETTWPEAEVFWNPPSRNATGSAFIVDGNIIHHLNGMGAAASWGNLALVHRSSADNGVTWSPTRIVNGNYGLRNMPIASAFVAQDGRLVLPCDAVTGGASGSCIHESTDSGRTFTGVGGTAAGIHCVAIELLDSRLMTLGRGDDIDGCMPLSVSHDGGRTWQVRKSPFPGITGGQRATILRLLEGPLLFMSFTPEFPGGGSGLFAATSEDEGDTWVYRRLVTPGVGPAIDAGAWTGAFTPSATTAEPKGYLTSLQTRDGTIHVFSSALTYKFNYEWLMEEPR
jgi:formylglycine-generating enzyme required for sulfatase activity